MKAKLTFSYSAGQPRIEFIRVTKQPTQGTQNCIQKPQISLDLEQTTSSPGKRNMYHHYDKNLQLKHKYHQSVYVFEDYFFHSPFLTPNDLWTGSFISDDKIHQNHIFSVTSPLKYAQPHKMVKRLYQIGLGTKKD